MKPVWRMVEAVEVLEAEPAPSGRELDSRAAVVGVVLAAAAA